MNPLPKNELRRRIRQLNRMDSAEADFHYLRKLIEECISGFSLPIHRLGSGTRLFRVRPNPGSKPTSINELKAPPPEAVVGYQRCNGPHNPMFYSSSRRVTALLECDVSSGDTVYISQWMVRDKIPVHSILRSDIYDDKLSERLDASLEVVMTYFDTIFTRRIHSTFSDDYKFTAAIAEILTQGYSSWGEGERTYGDIGLYFPSVADTGYGHNIALRPALVDSELILVHVIEAVIKDRSGSRISIEVTDNAVLDVLDTDQNEIIWTGDPTKVPKLNEDAKGTTFKNGTPLIRLDAEHPWQVMTQEEEPTAEQLESLLME